jgi:hypothetical protein
MIVREDFLGVLFVELRTLAYTQDGNDGDDKGYENGSSGVEDGHRDEEKFENVFDGIEDVDEWG